ncbi:MAG: PAS domain S-box protein [Bacteroidia bacterium]|nr:PAS domain S-box protein [Bacteroidia bacterium]
MDIFFQLNRISEFVNKAQQQYILNRQTVPQICQTLLENTLPMINCEFGLLVLLPPAGLSVEKPIISVNKGMKTETPAFQNFIEWAKMQNKPIFTEEMMHRQNISAVFQENIHIYTLAVLLVKCDDNLNALLILGNYDREDEFDLITLLKPVTTALGVIFEDYFEKLKATQTLQQADNKISQAMSLPQANRDFYLSSIFQASEKAITVLDKTGTILFMNSMVAKNTMLYQNKEIKVGDNIFSFLIKGIEENFRRDFDKACKGEEINLVLEIEVMPNKKNWFEIQFLPIFDDKKEVQAVAFSAFDVTKNKKIETALRETYHEINNFRTALYSSALIIVTDLRGYIIDINHLACQLSGYEKNEILSQSIDILNSGYHDEAFFRDMWNTIRKGKSWRNEIRHKTKDNQFFWTDTIINPVTNEHGEVYQYLWVNYIITERKIAEEQQNRLLRNLYEFAFETSHGLRKPLANILGLVSVFDKNNLSNEFNQVIIEKVQESAMELDEIVTKMTKLLAAKNIKVS